MKGTQGYLMIAFYITLFNLSMRDIFSAQFGSMPKNAIKFVDLPILWLYF